MILFSNFKNWSTSEQTQTQIKFCMIWEKLHFVNEPENASSLQINDKE